MAWRFARINGLPENTNSFTFKLPFFKVNYCQSIMVGSQPVFYRWAQLIDEWHWSMILCITAVHAVNCTG